MTSVARGAFGVFGALLVTTAAWAEPPAEQPGKFEAGLYVGGFISNYYHQFYDIDAVPNREELDRWNPLFGTRFAMFPTPYVGVELEASQVAATTRMSGQGARIFGLRAQVMVQRPARLTPFAALGAGVTYVMSHDDVLGNDADVPLHVGAGVRWFATPVLALRADARYLRGPSKQDPYTLNAGYGEFTVGVSFNPATL